MPSLKEDNSFLIPLKEKPLAFLLIAWVLVLIILYQWHGVQIVHDSYRYFAYAESFASGTSYWQHSDSVFYSSYTLFLYFLLHILGTSIGTVIITQLMIGTLALLCFYVAILNLTNSKISACISTLLYILWPDLQQWHLYIHTESLYISISIFILYFLSIKKQTFTVKGAIFILLMIALFLRPNGFILSVGVGAYYLNSLGHKLSYSVKLLTVLSVLLIPVLIYILKEILEVFSPLQYLEQGQIIQGYDGLNVAVNLEQSGAASSVLEQLLYTVLKQPFAFLELLFFRFIFFWGQIRPYYSQLHNIIIALFFIPVYIAAILGIKRRAINRKILAFIVIIIVLQTLMAMVVAVDWDNRFISPILPFVFIFAGIGFRQLIRAKVVSNYRYFKP